ncbi:MAG: TetR/AcrR family transcriptional regulator [Parahaliea sp.]
MPVKSKPLADGRRQRGEQSRQRIIAEALRLFSRYGYAGTSLSAIRDATGLPVSSLHHHFGSKAGICVAAIEYVGETLSGIDLRHRLRDIRGTSARAHTLVQVLLRHNRKQYRTLLLVIRLAMDAQDIDPAIRPAVRRIRQMAVDELVASLALVFESRQPPLPTQRLGIIARRMLSLMDGLMISHLTDAPDIPPAWAPEDIERLLLGLIGQ